jgi:hypothetical protein
VVYTLSGLSIHMEQLVQEHFLEWVNLARLSNVPENWNTWFRLVPRLDKLQWNEQSGGAFPWAKSSDLQRYVLLYMWAIPKIRQFDATRKKFHALDHIRLIGKNDPFAREEFRLLMQKIGLSEDEVDYFFQDMEIITCSRAEVIRHLADKLHKELDDRRTVAMRSISQLLEIELQAQTGLKLNLPSLIHAWQQVTGRAPWYADLILARVRVDEYFRQFPVL